MTLFAKIYVSHPDVVLADTLRTVQDATIRLEYQTTTEDCRPLYFFRASSDASDAFERSLRTDATVDDWRFVTQHADDRIYAITTRTDVEFVPTRSTVAGARVLDVTNDGEGWVVRLHLLTRDALVAFREYCNDNDVTYRIRELTGANSRRDEHSFGLTEEQRTVLLLAYNGGYYDIPRPVSQGDLAAELDVSTSAVSQRLRRATALLIANTIATDDR